MTVLTEEELAAVERERVRCQADYDRMLALSGNTEAAAALNAAWEPLLRQTPLPYLPCVPPYLTRDGEYPELLA